MSDIRECAGLCVSKKYSLVITSSRPFVKLDLHSLLDGSFIRSVLSADPVTCQALCICPGEGSVLIACRGVTSSYVAEVDITNAAIDPTIRFIGREDGLRAPVSMDCNSDVIVVAEYLPSNRYWCWSRINVFSWTDGRLIARCAEGHGVMFPCTVHMLRNARQFMVADNLNHRLYVFDNFSGELVKGLVCLKEPKDVLEMPDRDSLLVGFQSSLPDMFEMVPGGGRPCCIIFVPQFRNWHHLASVPDIGMVVVAKQPYSHDIITLIGVTSSLRRAWLRCSAVSCK